MRQAGQNFFKVSWPVTVGGPIAETRLLHAVWKICKSGINAQLTLTEKEITANVKLMLSYPPTAWFMYYQFNSQKCSKLDPWGGQHGSRHQRLARHLKSSKQTKV